MTFMSLLEVVLVTKEMLLAKRSLHDRNNLVGVRLIIMAESVVGVVVIFVVVADVAVV